MAAVLRYFVLLFNAKSFSFSDQNKRKTVELFRDNEPSSHIKYSNFSWGTQQILSHYTRAINKQEGLTGSLFAQNTKAKQVSSEWSWEDYSLCCFRYILQNPVNAGLVRHPAEWEFSAYRDFVGIRNGTLCNMEMARLEMSFDLNSFDTLMDEPVPSEVIKKLL